MFEWGYTSVASNISGFAVFMFSRCKLNPFQSLSFFGVITYDALLPAFFFFFGKTNKNTASYGT